MHAHLISFPAMPGFVTMVGDDEADAKAMFKSWHGLRFHDQCGSLDVRLATSDAIVDYASLETAMTFGQKGIAVWIGQPGWVVLPVEMAAPGPTFLDKRPVQCFEFEHGDRGLKVHVFAANADDARQLFTTWHTEQFLTEPAEIAFRHLSLRDLSADKARWRDIAQMGVIGIGSGRRGIFDILPPWDDDAGM